MVRVAGLKRRIRENDGTTGPDGLTAMQTLTAVAERARRLSDEQHQCFLDQLEPLLAAEGIRVLSPSELKPEQQRFLDAYLHRTVLPVVTPLAIEPGHPFPHLGNRSHCLIASLTPSTPSPLPQAALSVVHIPTSVVPHFVQLPAPPGEYAFILLENVIRLYLPRIYHGYTINSCLDPGLRAQIAAILDVQLGDTVKARLIRPDGTSQRISASPGLRSQERLWELTQPLRP
jgi:polyphosphate kinase